MRDPVKAAFLIVTVTAVMCASDPCHAQPDLGRATRETDRAVSDATTRKLTGRMKRVSPVSIAVEGSGSADGSGGGDETGGTFYVKDIRFTGMRRLTPTDIGYITKKYTHRELASRDVKKLTKEIEWEYLKRGLVSVVFVPEQDIRDDTLSVHIIEPDTD